MHRLRWTLALAAWAVGVAACGGGGGGGGGGAGAGLDEAPDPAFLQLLQGEWQMCGTMAGTNGTDFSSRFAFGATGAGSQRWFLYSSANGSCSMGERDDGTDGMSYTVRGRVQASLDSAQVVAHQIDLHWDRTQAPDEFDIVYIDTAAHPYRLYRGSGRKETEAGRPTTLGTRLVWRRR